MERRKFERFRISNLATYKPHRFSTKEALTDNISLKGACFFSEKRVKPQKIIILKIYFGPKIGSKQVKARVVYSSPLKDVLGEGYLIGVEFLDLLFGGENELKNYEY